MDNFIYNGNYHMIVGEFTPRNVFAGNSLIFNIKEHENRGLPNLYDMVRNGSWTLERFEEIIKDTAQDLDGDGIITHGDFYGMNNDSTTLHSFYFATGNNIVTAEIDTLVDKMTGDKAVSMIQRLSDLFNAGDVNTDSWNTGDVYGPNILFMDGKALFNCMVLVDLTEFRDSDIDYGIVPLPKYDEAQDSHISLGNINVVSAIILPKSTAVDATDDLGRIIESMTVLGHYKSLPEAYEATLLTKMTRDEDSIEMIQIINESLALDFGYVYNIGGLNTMLRTLAINKLPFISQHEKSVGIIESDIYKLLKAFE